ncbi:MAG TPA: TIR domain-containing protein [Rhizomicrobium sp.]|nr:TIR domain-containing protein [Rhizomicrobium sp.]
MTGPDIFLSYNRGDLAAARCFAEAFAREGLQVWWDVALRSGEAYDEVTENALREAKVVVVLWSKRSVTSRWVRAEAALAERKKTLMPAMIEPCERPIMFELVQTAELSHWRGDELDPAWRNFIGDVRHLVGRPISPAGTARETAISPGKNEISIIVLPFTNMSGDPEQDYFSDGITDDIITDLGKVSSLVVIARNTAFTFRHTNVDVVAVARQVDVGLVLEGSVRKAGNRVRVTAQLIDGSTGRQLWSERYDRNLDDIFALQDELSHAIVGALRIKLSPQDKAAIENRGTDNVQAYDLYMKGQAQYRLQEAQARNRAIALFQAAVALDPNFGHAWLQIGICHVIKWVRDPKRAEIYRPRILEAYERAAVVATDPLVVSHATGLKAMFDWDWVGAGEAFEAIPLNKATAEQASSVAYFYTSVGRSREATILYHDVIRRDPLASIEMASIAFDCARRFEEANAEADRVAKLVARPVTWMLLRFLRSAVTDDPALAKTHLERYLALKDDYMPVYKAVARCFADREMALGLLMQAFQEEFYQDFHRMVGIAFLAAYFGGEDLALACLRRAFVELPSVRAASIWHPLFSKVRKREEFKRLAIELGFSKYWRTSGRWGDFARPVGSDDFEIVA